MSQEISLKKTIDEIMRKSPGKLRGAVFETHARYIEQREGKQGLGQLEKKLAELGYPLRFKEIKTFEFYPTGLADAVLVVAKEIFSWTEEDVFDMGNKAPKSSLLVRLLTRYFLNPERVLREATKYWRKNNTEGEIEYEWNKKEKKLILRLKYGITHPLLCSFHAGFFLRLAHYVFKSPKITIKEIKCTPEGAEYLITWE